MLNITFIIYYGAVTAEREKVKSLVNCKAAAAAVWFN